MTKSPHTGAGEDFARCSAHVNYKDRTGRCERKAAYPDLDGIRWWCGLHNPNRKKAKEKKAKLAAEVAAETSVEESGLSVSGVEPVGIKPEIVEAINKANDVLTQVANARDTGWPEATPAENYKVLLRHINELAVQGRQALSEALRQINS